MATVKDPVCGMDIDSGTAAATSTVGGSTYYFCSKECQRTFEANPSRYTSASADVASTEDSEVLERNLTQKGGVTAPRFGSAGSGGFEFEGPPGTTRSK